MNPYRLKQLGHTALSLPALGCGTATIGDMRGLIPEAQSTATLEAAWAAGISFYDSAPWYGRGKSELRLGSVLRAKPRDAYTLTTKVGRTLHRPADPAAFAAAMTDGSLPIEIRFDYTRDGVMRSYEDSIQRMGIPVIDALLIHDLDPMHHGDDGVEPFLRQLEDGGGFAALQALKASGEIKAIGVGINMLGMIPRFIPRFPIDFFLVAMPYTLLDQGALDHELPLCAEHGAGVIIGAPFASGILASRTGPAATYAYRPVETPTATKVARIDDVCHAHGVPIGAVALQFPLAHPLVASIIPGPNHPDQVRTNMAWLRTEVPAALWRDLKSEGLLHPDAPIPVD
jgi:D-threo-aldose 1-dehydrogenase